MYIKHLTSEGNPTCNTCDCWLISKSQENLFTVMGINPLRYFLWLWAFVFPTFEKEMKVSTLEGDFANSSGYLCVYIPFGTRNKTVFDYSETPQWRLCLWSVQGFLLILTDLLYLPWCYCVIDLQKTWKTPFSSPGYWEFNFKFFTWNNFVGMKSHLQCLL